MAFLPFTKMHGAGNDYIYVNALLHPIKRPEALSVAWSSRHKGIGADGLVLLGASAKADFGMRIFNADGSEASMCGNAALCIGKYVYEKGLTAKTALTLETLSGIKELRLNVANGKVKDITVDMGVPTVIEPVRRIAAGGHSFSGAVISMGNPHFVVFTDNINAVDLPAVGPLIENHPSFPDRTNVEFAEVKPSGVVRMRVWERGSGITLACGTGACAVVVAGVTGNQTGRDISVAMDGGTRRIVWDNKTNRVFMTGDAALVFEGEIELEQ